MSDYTYTKKGSATTDKIAHAPISTQKIWNRASTLGVNVLRVRAHKERNETTQGATFNGYHKGKVSIYTQRSNPTLPLWFRRFVKLGEANVGMQVLEVARNLDAQEVQETLDEFDTYINGNIFTRLFNAIKTVLA